MHPADITAALRKRRSSQALIARQLGVSKSAVCAIVNGRQRSRRIESAIARATGLPVGKLWPGRKAPSGRAQRAATTSSAATAAGAI